MFLGYFHHSVPNLSNVSSTKCQLHPEAQQQLLEADLEYITRTINTIVCYFLKHGASNHACFRCNICLSPKDLWGIWPGVSQQALLHVETRSESLPKKHSGNFSARETQRQLLCWFRPEQGTVFHTDSAADLKGQTAPHKRWIPDPWKGALWARLEHLPKLGNFKTHSRDSRIPGSISPRFPPAPLKN